MHGIIPMEERVKEKRPRPEGTADRMTANPDEQVGYVRIRIRALRDRFLDRLSGYEGRPATEGRARGAWLRQLMKWR